MKSILSTFLLAMSFSSFSMECPEGSFEVKDIEAYQLDYRESWGQRYELSVRGNGRSTPVYFSGDLVVEKVDILERVKRLELPVRLDELCVQSRPSEISEGEEELVLVKI